MWHKILAALAFLGAFFSGLMMVLFQKEKAKYLQKENENLKEEIKKVETEKEQLREQGKRYVEAKKDTEEVHNRMLSGDPAASVELMQQLSERSRNRNKK
ncbi:hypothetical protein [Treponema sp.]|uniref:hypothetical protein n=1 Tax=Treponema sp. TaxID=166 RepID=UPI00298E8FB2|nr:hypothetical protein [Treponema sp.]MCQ2242118.1 hypothetical protein [Treponema sp.]